VEYGGRVLPRPRHLLEGFPGRLANLVDVSLRNEPGAERQPHQDVVGGDLPGLRVGDLEPAAALPDLADEEGLLTEGVGEGVELAQADECAARPRQLATGRL